MITVIAVDSLRSIPISAQYGFSLVFYYLLAASVFLVPCALVSAELASTYPKTGGLYVWIKEAFGDKWATFVIWLEWFYNICWYPTILALLASTIIYPFYPELTNSKTYMISTIIALYWLATWINLQGIAVSASMSRFTAIVGTLVPMTLISLLGLYWFKQGNNVYLDFSFDSFIPDLKTTDNWIFLSNIFYSLVGVEITAYHAQDVKNPQKNFPRALFLSSIIILSTIIFSSLAVACVIPKEILKTSLISGMLDAFKIFFTALNLSYLFPLICIMIAVGTLGGVGAWLIGPSKGLLIAAEDGHLPPLLAKKNTKGVPQNILIIQGIVFTVLSSAYIIMPNVNSAFVILSILTSQLSLFGYIFMFAAVIKLRKSQPNIHRPFKIPGKTFGLFTISGMGALACIFTILLSFFPPNEIASNNIIAYRVILSSGFVLFLLAIYGLSVKHCGKHKPS